uniref:Uncharacterized protein n=1 Tax=Diacronema lutheri TaxID=2081491 RepID=A0A7R9YI39_DIALT
MVRGGPQLHARAGRRVCAVALAPPPSARRAAVGEWAMLSGPFVGAKVILAADGSVTYASPSGTGLWRGVRWEAVGRSESALRVILASIKSGDELSFDGDMGPGGEEGSLALSGRVLRSVQQRRVSRWDFAKSLAWGDARDSEDIGPFVLLRQAPS